MKLTIWKIQNTRDCDALSLRAPTKKQVLAMYAARDDKQWFSDEMSKSVFEYANAFALADAFASDSNASHIVIERKYLKIMLTL